MAAVKKKRFGEHLVNKGLINQDKLDEALRKQGGYQKKLGETLVALRYMSEDQLAKVLADLSGVPAIDLAKFKIEPDAARRVGGDFCAKNRLIPIAVKNHNRRDHLVVAFSDPLDLDVIDELRFIVDLPVFRVCATVSAIKEALLRVYPQSKPDSTIPGSISVSGDPADYLAGAGNLFENGAFRDRHPPEGATEGESLKLELQRLDRAVKLLTRALADNKVLRADQADALARLLGLKA